VNQPADLDGPGAFPLAHAGARTPSPAGRIVAGAHRLTDPALWRTLVLTAAMAGVALSGFTHAGGLSGIHAVAPGATHLPWWVFALAFAVTELAVFEFERERERTTFTFAEIPLVVALFWAAPLPALVGRLVGEFAVLAFYERQIPRKLLLNLASFAAECTVAFWVFDRIVGRAGDGPGAATPPVTNPRAWLAALLAVAAADATSMIGVALAKRFHGAPIGITELGLTNVITATTNTGLAVTALLLVHVRPLALLPLGLIAAMVLLAWHSYAAVLARLDSMRLLYEFTRLVAGTRRASDVVTPLLGRLRELLAAGYAAVHLFDDAEDGTVHVQSWTDGPSPEPGAGAQPLSGGRVRACVVAVERAHGRPARPSDVERHRLLADALGHPHGLAAALYADGAVVGAVVVDARRVDLKPFDNDDARLFNTVAHHAGVAVENAKLFDRLREENIRRTHEARHDPLTGLPNRLDFDSRVNDALLAARADARPFAVGVMDLDRFKEVNDTFGHHVGDALLVTLGARLRQQLPAHVVIARLGGDEFALLVTTDASVAALADIGGQISAAVSRPFAVEHATIRVGTSIGFSRFPFDGSDAASLLREADAAMYRAKGRPDGAHIHIVQRDRLSVVED
jgi:diguanylate cyclase (GGDEF)-like protein